MNLSNTAQYALRVLSYMALNEEELYSASELVKKLNVSDKYLKRIMTSLSKKGFIRSIHGRNGGYVFAKSLKQISLYDVLSAVDDMKKYEGCILGFDKCADDNPCALHSEWAEIRDKQINFFKQISLEQIGKIEHIMKY